MGQLFSQPLTEKSVVYKELETFSYCLGSMQGYRLTQEDAHSINFYPKVQSLDKDGLVSELDIKIFGIYDGHGGSETSSYLGETLADEIIRQFRDPTVTKPQQYRTNHGLYVSRFKDAFFKIDADIYGKLLASNSGSTAILAVIINDTDIYAVNTGDSRLIMSLDGAAKTLSFDHKPSHIGELIRINDAGGSVSFHRVGGILALSRAFGDFSFKLRKLRIGGELIPSEETQVTVEPDVISHRLGRKDEFIVLACDGIWDVFKGRDLVHYIRHKLCLGWKLDEIVTKLLEHSIGLADHKTGVGFDNMSVIIIAYQQAGESMEMWYMRMKHKVEYSKGISQ